jgi:predicted secreted hydrolase
MRRLLSYLLLLALLLAAFIWLRGRQAPAPATGSLSVSQALGEVPEAGFSRALSPRAFRFPQDHGPHPGYRTEWWYFTGNLKTSEGRPFGYQLTFFRMALAPGTTARASKWGADQVYMAHFALTDVQGKRFAFAERFSRAALGLAGAGGAPLSVWLEDWSARESSASPWSMKLSAADGSVSLDLDLASSKPVVLNGEQGLSRKGSEPGNASYYYSIPRMESRGTLTVGGERFQVSGLSWLDREWGTSALTGDQAGWDWFALQLDDGRDLMFYSLRKKDGSADPFSAGTLIGVNGGTKRLGAADVQLSAVGWWTSPKSGTRYPARWRLLVPGEGIELEVVPRLADQELLTSFRYWEGAVTVRGMGSSTVGGSGYLEMTGYGDVGGTKERR